MCIEEDAEIPSEALPLLVRMLVDRDAEVSQSGMYALGYCGEEGLAALLHLLEDRDPYARERACEAIANARMEREQARHPLLAALADPVPEVRSRAAFALGLMPDPSTATIDALAALARDPVPAVRNGSLHALGNAGRGDAVPPGLAAHVATVVGALDDVDPDVRKSAAYALEGLKLPAGRLLALFDGRLRANPADGWRGMLGALRKLAEREDLAPHFDTLHAIARDYPDMRFVVIAVCQRLGARAAALAPLIEQEMARDDRDVVALAEALHAVGGRAEAAVPRLRALLDGDMHEALRAGKVLVTITGDGQSIVPMLERALEQSPDEPSMAIQEIGPPVAGVAAALARAIDENFDEPDWDVMWGLTSALSRVESPEPVAVNALAKSLSHPSGIVKGTALGGLEKLGPAARAALPALAAALKEGDADWKRSARAAIAAIERSPN